MAWLARRFMHRSFAASREWNWPAFSNVTARTRKQNIRKFEWRGRSTKCSPTNRSPCASSPHPTISFLYTKACLEAGRDVVVDKPFTPTYAEAEQLVHLAAERGRLLTVYQDRR